MVMQIKHLLLLLLLQRKKRGTLNNGAFLQIAKNIPLDIDYFLSPDGQILKICQKNCKPCI